ncbi:MAG: malto-oligosyltrehalose trehalohydrolase [Pseudomonadota bacterium]
MHNSEPFKSHHTMPFGAELEPYGGVRFRLWAPAATGVELCLESGAGESRIPMVSGPDGWWERCCDKAGAGSRYSFCIDNDIQVPDPASRFQPDDVHGNSEVIDPRAFSWGEDEWSGRPWHEAVIYELHVGTFTDTGNFRAVEAKLDHLRSLGVTVIELMPLADFPGERDWGYNGVLPFAPDAVYGRPDDLKHLIRAAHESGLMVFLDVVYNHFGPEGNYLHRYAPAFFTHRYHTPWGDAINFDGESSRQVRDFFIHNALYWLEEYRVDGLRLDAVHAIFDDSTPDILEELAEAVNSTIGTKRHVHLVLENDNNAAHYLKKGYRAQWNDDLHHCLHILLSGERDGYYSDYTDAPLWYLGRCLAEGFAYQGEVSEYREGRRRGEASADLPPTAFVSFLQNHDQVGNRAFGERFTELSDDEALRAATAILLLAPQPPLLFMGQEWGSRRRFPFFCDFEPALAKAVTKGRRKEFARFDWFADPAARARIPEPGNPDTFLSARLDWSELDNPASQQWLSLHRTLLSLRRSEIVPRLSEMNGNAGHWRQLGDQGIEVVWHLNGGAELLLQANLSAGPLAAQVHDGKILYATHEITSPLPPWFVAWYLSGGDDR